MARYPGWNAPYPRELVGDCALAPQTHEARTVEIGFTIAPEHQGRGYAREAVSWLLR